MSQARRGLAVLATMLLAVAGCGSVNSSAGGPTTTARPTPRPVFAKDQTFTPEQLQAALPTAEDVPGARRIEMRCRFFKVTDHCTASKKMTYASVVLSTHVSPRLAKDDHSKPAYWRPEEYDVIVDQYPDLDAAAPALDDEYDLVKEIDGNVSTKASRAADGDINWGLQGTGKVDRTKFLGLDGLEASAREADVDLAGRHSKPMQVAVAASVWNRYRVLTKVVYYDALHQPGEALTKAKALMTDYLERLDKVS